MQAIDVRVTKLQTNFKKIIDQYFNKMCNITNSINAKRMESNQLNLNDLIEYDGEFKTKTIVNSTGNFFAETIIFSILFILILLIINKMFLGLTSVLYPSLGIGLLVACNRFCGNKRKANETINKHYCDKVKAECLVLEDEIKSLEKDRDLVRNDLENLRKMSNQLNGIVNQLISRLESSQIQDIPEIDIEQLLIDIDKQYQLTLTDNH